MPFDFWAQADKRAKGSYEPAVIVSLIFNALFIHQSTASDHLTISASICYSHLLGTLLYT